MSDWQSIETAPKDGRCVILFGEWAGEINGKDDGPDCYIGSYSGKGDYPGYAWSVWGTDAHAAWVKPSHWMDLPAPPSVDAGGG